MNVVPRRISVRVLGTAVACVLCAALASGQAKPVAPTAPAQKPPQMAENVLKNVQVLKGIPLDEFMGTMGFFAAALSLNCTDCHVAESLGNWDKYAEDTPLKETARKMILMVRALNKANFAGQPMVTCYTCHRSSAHPKVRPSLTEQYGVVPDIDPDDVESVGQASSSPGAPSADQILDKYIAAVGGAERLATLSSFLAKGTYEGFDTADHKVPVEVYAKAPDLRATVAHVPIGDGTTKDSITTYNGRAGWIFAPNTLVPMLELTGGNLDGAKVDAELSFPGQIKQTLAKWRADYPETTIEGHAVRIVSGIEGKSLVKLYFDKDSGLLVRQLRDARTAVGPNPTQVDYSDYRDVAGIKLPFHWELSWTDGQSTFELSEVQPNVPVDAAKFAKPTP